MAEAPMSQDWADGIARQLLSRSSIQKGLCLILGGSDTGKTTLAAALARCAASSRPVGIVDTDIGQSHIGPPTTVGWAILDDPQVDFSRLAPLEVGEPGSPSSYGQELLTGLAVGGISFVGDVTPVGHLLQLTAAVTQGIRQVSKNTELIIIDTPGFIRGPAAAALWWTVQRVLQPELIVAVRRSEELSDILCGLQSFDFKLELVKSPPQIPFKSPQDRRRYRWHQFSKYFRDSRLYDINLSDVAVQMSRNLSRESAVSRLVALRDGKGMDIGIGVITDWQNDRNIVTVRAPEVDIQRVRCLVIGYVSIEISE